MRKNIKNNMITRILAIGLATAVFATSAPASVFADDEETVTVESSDSSSDSSSESSSDSSSESSSDSSESVSCESEAPAVEAAHEVATEAAPEVAEAAAEESTVVAEILIIDNNVAPEAEAVAAAPEATVEGQEVAEAETPAAPEKSLVEIASESIDNLEDKTETVKSTEQKSSDEADSAVENAEVANTSKSKKEAYQAKDDAVADITAAEADLEKVNAAYEEAVVAKEQAEADVAAAEAEYNAAVEQLNEARRTASQNLTAAQAQLNDAQSAVNRKAAELDALKDKKAELDKVELQYYAVMDYYYKTVLKTAQYDENGKLDVEKSAENVSNDTINKKAKTPGNNDTEKNEMYMLGRGLMYDLIEYMLKGNENVDPTSIHIGEKSADDKNTKVDEKAEKEKTAKFVSEKEDGEKKTDTKTLYWNDPDKSKGNTEGRCNHIVVTYTDKDGNKHTEFYNYVFKDSDFNHEYDNKKIDIENGPVYLALVKQGEDGKWSETHKIDDNNLDNYGELTKKIEDMKTAISNKETELRQAEAARDRAAERVADCREELRRLENTTIDDSKVKELKERLAEAVEDLSEAEEAKEALEVQVEEARKIVDAIDLSRFNRNDESSYEESSDDTDPVVLVYTIPTIEDIPEIIPTISSVLPTVIPSLPTSGVLGVRVVADAGSDNVVSDVTKKPVAVKEINLGGDVIGKENGKKLVKIDNNIVPLAAAPGVVEANGFNWWWILLLVGTAVVIFVVVYKKRKEEDEAKAVNK